MCSAYTCVWAGCTYVFVEVGSQHQVFSWIFICFSHWTRSSPSQLGWMDSNWAHRVLLSSTLQPWDYSLQDKVIYWVSTNPHPIPSHPMPPSLPTPSIYTQSPELLFCQSITPGSWMQARFTQHHIFISTGKSTAWAGVSLVFLPPYAPGSRLWHWPPKEYADMKMFIASCLLRLESTLTHVRTFIMR